MYAKVKGSSIIGMEGFIIDIEVDLANGLPQFQIVGLPDSSIRESKDRVRAAIKNSGYEFPMNRITINLAPADIKKEGTGFDLPFAFAILLASEQININRLPINLNNIIVIGELSLDGSIQPVNGILPMVMSAKENNIEAVIISKDNAEEANLVDGIRVLGFSHLSELVDFASNNIYVKTISENVQIEKGISITDIEDFAEVKGHYQVKRAIEVAVAGMHNLLMIGPPGSGKSMIAKRIPSVLPKLTWDEILDVTKVYSVAGELKGRVEIIDRRPFRKPHHSISIAGLIGGGSIPRPGEISLAHRGVLFLDELPEFPRNSLEGLRQPLEDGMVTISRARANYIFPSELMLVGAMNPCKCGYFGSKVPKHDCQCTPLEVQRYRSRLSGPLLDRIDIQIEVPWVSIETLRDGSKEKNSREMRENIENARNYQKNRFKNSTTIYNSKMNNTEVKSYCKLDPISENLLKKTFNQLGYSGRTLDRILKISRTIADLEQSNEIKSSHIAEAMNYRILDRKY
ncbi:MAG: YifB family Mg chelatase-like AAA ATPase [Vulcanibacillus sp.]